MKTNQLCRKLKKTIKKSRKTNISNNAAKLSKKYNLQRNKMTLVRINTKGCTRLKARNTVDDLTNKVTKFKHGFEIPASIAKKIKQRRIIKMQRRMNCVDRKKKLQRKVAVQLQ